MARTTTHGYTNRQGNTVEIVRNADGSVKSVEVSGTGSNRAFQAQLRAARIRADKATVIVRPAHEVQPRKVGSSICFCACGQGFSGFEADERLAAHVNNPDPNSTAALLQKVMA